MSKGDTKRNLFVRMVLQSLVLSVLKGYLGEFLHDLDNDKLQLELWNGEVELKDCELNPSALDKYDPPVEIVAGSVSTLKLIIQVTLQWLKSRAS